MSFDVTRKSVFQLEVESFVHTLNIGWETSNLISGNVLSWNYLLKKDANSLYINALFSLLDALGGIKNKTWSWSMVKLYYSLFYIFKTELYLDVIGLFRNVNNPKATLYEIDLRTPTYIFKKGTEANPNNDHHRIFNVHESVYRNSDPLYSQTIDNEKISTWMRNQREIANYKQIKFEDPIRNDLFIDFDFTELGKFELLNPKIYLDSTAIVAIPISKCIQVRQKFSDLLLSQDTHELILSLCTIANVPEDIQEILLGRVVIV